MPQKDKHMKCDIMHYLICAAPAVIMTIVLGCIQNATRRIIKKRKTGVILVCIWLAAMALYFVEAIFYKPSWWMALKIVAGLMLFLGILIDEDKHPRLSFWICAVLAIAMVISYFVAVWIEIPLP